MIMVKIPYILELWVLDKTCFFALVPSYHLFVVTPALRFGSACHEVIHLNVKSLGLLGLLLVQQFIRFGDQEEVVAAFFLGRPVRTNLFGHMCSKKYENIINFKEA